MFDSDLVDKIFDKTQEIYENMMPVNIMIIGKTGVGKSTLINNVFRERLAQTGIGKPITEHLRKINREGIPITIYDTKGIELNEATQSVVKKEIQDKIQELSRLKDEGQYIHCIWYCINSLSNRIEDFEIKWIEELSKNLPVIVVLTQCINTDTADVLRGIIERLNLKIVSVEEVLAEEYSLGNITIPPFGLKQLVNKTYEVLPEGVRRAFNNAQKVDVQKKAESARKWVNKYAAGAFGVGFTPIPFSDAAVLTPMQITMIAHITNIFGVKMDKSNIASIVTSVGGVGGAAFAGRTIASNLLKLVPGAGTVLGGVISGSTASFVTTALGYAYIEVMKYTAKAEFEGKKLNNEMISELLKKNLKAELKKKH